VTEQPAEGHERRVLGTELLWAFGVGVLVAAILGMIVFTALTRDINPPSNVEFIDPKTLHLSGEFHGLLITGTNVNTMVVPGFVAQVYTEFTQSGDLLMPCHEYCGLGHSDMWANVQVVPESEFKPDQDGRVSCAQR